MTPDALAQLIVQTCKSAIAPVKATIATLEARQTTLGELEARRSGERLELAALRERIAVLETRAPVAGPPGRDGLDGRDGADGVGIADLTATFDGDRTLTLAFQNGVITKTIPITLPIPRYRGVYVEGKRYDVGECVTWAGSVFHCQAPTDRRPSDHAGLERGAGGPWRLMVKSGRDYTRRAPAPAGGT